MGDIGSGLAYLCCCMKDAEVSADGSRFGSRTKPDPREQEIDEAFSARNYHRDATGRFYTQPTPTSSMLLNPRQLSDQSKKSETGGSSEKPVESAVVVVIPPKLGLADSTSTEETTFSIGDANGNPELLVTPPPD